MADRVYLVDGSGYIFRAFYAVPHLTTKSGFPTNALFGYTRMLAKLLKLEDAKYIAVVFDTGADTFRDAMYDKYKANRSECPSDLVEQMPFFRTISKALGLPVLEMDGYEADDLIGTLAKRISAHGSEVVIVSGDKDLMQLVDDKVTIWDTMHERRFTASDVKEKFGVPPEKVVEVLGLMGDSSDNIPGLDGCGPKTATQLIEKYGSVEGVLSSIEALKEDKSIRNRTKIAETLAADPEIVRLSRKLVEINTKVPMLIQHNGGAVPIEKASDQDVYHAMVRRDPEESALQSLSEQLEFHSLLDEFSKGIASKSQAKSACQNHVIYKDEFPTWVRKFSSVKAFAFDTETTSLDVTVAEIIGASFCWDNDEAYYVPLAHHDSMVEQGRAQIGIEEFFKAVAPVMQDSAKQKFGQNLKYDINIFARYGVEVDGASFDTMVAAWILNPDRSTYNLTALAEEFLHKPVIEYDEVIGLLPNLAAVEVSRAAEYACQDAYLAWLLTAELKQRLAKEDCERIFNEVEMPLVPVLAAMERKGVMIDLQKFKDLSVEFSGSLEKLQAKIFEVAKGEFNINSPKQLGEVLFVKLQIPTKGLKKTKTGISTDSSVLEKLAPEHPIADLILAYRMLHKLKSTYVDALPAQVSKATGRLHSKFNQTGTGTGRLSSSDPNLQNIPIQTAEGRRIREAFVSPEGYELISADYSQIELRLLAHMAEDANMIAAFNHGVDIHSLTAREIAGLPADAPLTDAQRRVGKTINFGIIYGMGGFRLGKELGIPIGVANGYIESYFARYPAVKKFFAKLEEDAVQKGFVTTMYGRKRIISDLDISGRDQGFMMRVAINAPLQGTAADLIKIAMTRISNRLKKERLQASIIMQIHDELVVECERTAREGVSSLMKEEMERVASLRVPLKVDIGWGKNWQEAHA